MNGPLPAVAVTAYWFALVVTTVTAPVLMAWIFIARVGLTLARLR
jgi:hypothetical protein